MGRPSDYSPELTELICARMAEGESLRSICRDDAMPALSTVFLWLGKHAAFSEQYARAIDARATVMEEDILAISDDSRNDTSEDDEGRVHVNNEVIQRSKLRVDTRKWLMARMAPKKYGDKVEQTLKGDPENPLQTINVIELVAAPFPQDTDTEEESE